MTRTVDPRPQLLTYPDSLGGDLRSLGDLLEGPLAGVFHGVHVLPPFPSSGDRGFAPLTYDRIDPRFGTWDDIRRIASGHDVLLDLMINHISRQSQEFQDFQRHGRTSEFADLFITIDKIWPDGAADGGRRRPDLPAQARRSLLGRDHRGHGPAGAGVDILRVGRLVRADRP